MCPVAPKTKIRKGFRTGFGGRAAYPALCKLLANAVLA
jgi:hypothetical protein